MAFSTTSSERLLSIYLALGQYPILSSRMRLNMRLEIFERGIIQPQEFEAEVREKAMFSQQQEGLLEPFEAESSDLWEMRQSRVRDQLTDLYFSQHLPYNLFEQIVRNTLKERGVSPRDRVLSINPELAPLSWFLSRP